MIKFSLKSLALTAAGLYAARKLANRNRTRPDLPQDGRARGGALSALRAVLRRR